MTAYISISLNKRNQLDPELDCVMRVLSDFKIVPFLFVDHYRFEPAQERIMMQQAMKDIDQCAMLIAETSDKAIGIGIEAGYAKAKGKPVIYMRRNTAEHSTTMSGISDFQIIYSDVNDLEQQFRKIITRIG
ncbi:nucleoside 2-deoxyribosyltransferase [Mucilaginibacter angelicae]|uniref:Nucleoside 2-deoxyribosyltransferase n=1 Tax=Mucilaginibacter angelicae TaxID=869718 RepID=A0ABV6L3A6_9SPHI